MFFVVCLLFVLFDLLISFFAFSVLLYLLHRLHIDQEGSLPCNKCYYDQLEGRWIHYSFQLGEGGRIFQNRVDEFDNSFLFLHILS